MPKPTPVTTRPARRGGAQTAAALLRALLSLTVLALLLAGLPILLWWATSLVGPPGLAALSHLLSTEDSGQVFLLVLAVAGWAGWVCFTGAVMLEIPAQLRGRTAPQIRGLVGQRAAATLVGAVLLALPAGTALAAPSAAAPLATPTGVSASPVSGSGTQSAPRADAPAGAPSTAVTYTVRDLRPAESLWSIAQQTLGSGERWTDIAALNDGRTMADGTVFDAERPIQPGWVLTLPADATIPSAPTTGAGAAGEGSASRGAGQVRYTVRDGDNLSSIAADQLGDPDRHQEIFNLNHGQPLPGGDTFNNPDLIYPGQQLTLPHTAGTGTPAPSPHTPEPGPTTPPAATAPPPATAPPASTAPPQTAPPAPSASAPAAAPSAQLPTRTPAPASPTPNSSPAQTPAPDAPRAQSATAGVNWAVVEGIGTLLAASLAGALGVRRILQQRQRRAGQTIAQDNDPGTLEQLLTAAGEPAGVELLDRILRALAHQAATNERELPTLRGVLLAGKEVRLLLDEPAEDPISPFTAGPDSRTWTLDPTAVLPEAATLHDVAAPYPGLVTLGAHQDGLLLADLTTCDILLLDGTPEEVLEVARALALELGTSGWTDYSEILTAGLGSRLAQLLPQGRIRTMPHLPAVAADLGELLLEAHQSGEQVLPWLMIGAGDHDGEHLAQLADALAAARNLKTAVVLPASEAARRAFPHAEILDVTTGQEALLAPLGLPVTLQRITDEQYRQYVHALQVSTQDPVPASGAWEFAESHDQAAASGKPLTLRATTADAQDPGNPFPALIAASPTTAPQPIGAQGTPEAGQPAADGAETATTDTVEPDETGQAQVPAQTAAIVPTQAVGEEQAPVRIDMLGPLRITGTAASAHGPRTAAIAALLHLRPGRGPEYLCQAMDPVNPWSTRTLHSRLSELRNVLGLTSDGLPLLPRPKNGAGYVLHPSVTSDWAEFKILASRGLAAGPGAGTADLEAAMALVRGCPFEGRTLPWADPVIQEMLSRITDTAHTLARWHTDSSTPDLDAARRTVQRALEVEETSEVLYRDLLHIEAAAGDQTAVRKVVARAQQMARTYEITLTDTTERTIAEALAGTVPQVTRA
ncbi:LysM peptidoglycan-binding domain-containing protein [Streptomyces sp. NPDC006662]|uniref:LysM peptidoglycan-binding domain-containing protein n=1 Tax=Streptomyces sp. NPDC006662 TaxID=3156902 RepID=UPI0033C1E24B